MKVRVAVLTAVAVAAALLYPQFVRNVGAEAFTISVQIPQSSGATFAVSKVTGNVWTPQNSNNLDFGELTLNANLGIFLPSYYYAIDVGGEGGSGVPTISVQYTDTGAPVGAIASLGQRGTFSYASVTSSNNGDVVTTLDGLSLSQANGIQITNAQLNGGWLRISIGMATGDQNLDEGNAIPFSLADVPGSYTGTLVLTAIVN